MNIRIKKHNLHSFLILLLVYQTVFISFPYFKQYTLIKYTFIVILAFLLLLRIKTAVTLHVDAKLITIMFLYIMVVILSGFLNQGKYTITNPLYGALAYCLSVLEIICALLYVGKRESPSMIIKTLYRISLIYVLINDLLLFINPSMFMRYGEYYFLGNKFSVAYAHIQLVALYILNNRVKNIKHKILFKDSIELIILCILSIVVLYTVGSTTGILGVLLLLTFIIVPNRLENNAIIWLITLLSACAFPVLYEVILANPHIESFIVDVLGKSITLTGRTVIYANIPNVLSNHLIFGHGFGSTYEVWINFINLPNSQNGLIDCVVEQGLIATTILVIMLFVMIKKSSSRQAKSNLYKPIIAMIYVYTILSAIEITINSVYIFWFVLLYVCSLYSKEKCIQK